MTRFLELLISIVIVIVLFVVVGVFLPSQRDVQNAMETNHPVRQVYDTINGFKRFGDWHPLRQHDPRVRFTLSGPPTGVGATLDYASTDPLGVGKGRWELVESEQDMRVKFNTVNEDYGTDKVNEFTLDNKGKTVEIQWKYSVDYGWNLLGRYAGLYVNRTVGDDIKRGLGNLVGLLATMPNFDYKVLGEIVYADLPIENILYISTTADRNITAVDDAMSLALTDIEAAIKANNLEAAGAPRLITTNFGAEKYEFDIAIPVRRPDPAAAAADGDESADADADADAADAPVEPVAAAPAPAAAPAAMPGTPVVPVAPPALTDLKLPANVLSGQSYGGRALMTDYTGHPATLPLVRDMLRSFAAAHGETVTDRAFEEYLTGMSETAADEAKFKVYWPIQ
ncbi:SRPBCC family protein [Chiayiivirga flava]|uniref:Type II secretory pathway pseudopilin PulG n=1 Tax=Chiayiivirga flava TaxID=659595 RepID=A0A7W8D3R2_9GAMM|nr:SRPBCC family protein [Chiayiivirga flava]MBB5207400.1 type II secretory pathway pseudopilin PulG [Chiayiivirga flava]